MEKGLNCVYIDTREDDWDEVALFFNNLRVGKLNENSCVILGVLQLWDGYHEIDPVCKDNISDAISATVRHSDYFRVSQKNGVINVAAYHHDGANNFQIKLLNKKGVEAAARIERGYGEANLGKKCYHKSLNDYLF